jgi:Viral BACON domain/Putative binding domain, N-terminal
MSRGSSRDLAVLLAVFLTVLAWPAAARAQDIVDARRVEFTPSVDNDVLSGSTPVVTNYSLAVFVAGDATPVETVNLGKPAPDADGLMRVDFVALLRSQLTPGVVYETALSTVGPGGTSDPAARTNTFSYSPPCTASISPQSQTIGSAGGSGSAAVTVAAGCTWTASSNASWIAITAGATGTGAGNVSFSVQAYTGTTNRVGNLTIAGATFTVTQTGTTCSFAISPASQSFAAAGGSGAVTMTTTLACSWTASSNASWVTISSGASGTGSSTTQFSVAANTGAARTAVLTVAGQAFAVSQAAAAPTCSFAISPASQSFAAAGGSGTVTLTTAAGCTWTASSNASWVTISSGASGTGSGATQFSVAANTGVARSAVLTVGGKAFTVSQAAAAPTCSFAISPASQSFAAAGGTGTVTLTTAAGCTWTASSNASWVAITSGASGTGSGTTRFSVAANTGAARSAVLTVAGKAFTVSQAAPSAACTYVVTPLSITVGSSGGGGTITVTTQAGCAWTATSPVRWITVSGSGPGSGTTSYTVNPNRNYSSRTATITVAGQAVTVTERRKR